MRQLSLLVVLCMMGTSALAYAQDKKTDPNTLIEEVLDLSGAKRQIAQIPAVVQVVAAQRKTGLQPEEDAKVGRILAESYQAEALYQTVKDHLTRSFDHQRFLVLLQWLRSPLARRLLDFEVRASTPEAMQDMQQFASQRHRKPPGRERLTLLRKLDEAAGVTEFNIEMILSSFRGLAKAIDPLLPPEKRLKKGQLEQLVSDMRAQMETAIHNEVILTMLYTYQSATDTELRAYVAFLESETGRWFSSVASDGMLRAMTAAAERAGTQVEKTFFSEKALKGK